MKNVPVTRKQNTNVAAWNPYREFSKLQREIDRVFEDFSPETRGWPEMRNWWPESLLSENHLDFEPSYEVDELDGHYLMSFDLPGVKKEDLKINIQDNVLTVTGVRRDECKDEGKGHFHKEKYYGSFESTFTLPSGVKADQIETEYSDGVLRVAVPKMVGGKMTGQQIKIGESKPGFFQRLMGTKKAA